MLRCRRRRRRLKKEVKEELVEGWGEETEDRKGDRRRRGV